MMDNELLRKISEAIEFNYYKEALKTLLEVVQLHENVFGYCGTCCWIDKYDELNSGSYEYPCPTIQAIEKELK